MIRDYKNYPSKMSISDIELDEYDLLFDRVCKAQGYPKIVKHIYDFCIGVRIVKKIESTRVYSSNGNSYVTYRNVRPQRPSGAKDLDPNEFLHITGSSYMLDIVGDIVRVDAQTDYVLEKLENVVICRLPLLLGSKYCKLGGKTDDELIAMGEDPSDPFGYFRIKSSEKLIIIQEHQRLFQPLIFVDSKGELDCRDTISCPRGTLILRLTLEKDFKAINIDLGHAFRGCPIPIYGVYYLLGKMNADEITGQILQFVQAEYHERALTLLTSSVQRLENMDSSEEYSISTKLKNYIFATFKRNQKNIQIDAIEAAIRDNLFPDVQEVENKLLHLSWLISHLVNHLLGIRPLDNRDSWSNKRLETAGRGIEKLFVINWTRAIEKRRHDASGHTALQDYQFIGSESIGDMFISAFVPNGWGAPSSQKKENIVDILKRSTALEVVQQITKVNTPASRESKSKSLREVSGTQVGIMDPAETVEGQTIGLIKNLAITAQASRELDPEPVIELVKIQNGYSPTYTDQTRTPIIVNGTISGWIPEDQADEIRISLRNLRRIGQIEYDVCINYNQISNQLEIYTNSDRPVRPLLIVDEASQELVIEQKGMINASFDELLYSGCLEYLDAREQEYAFVGESPTLMKYKINRKRKLEQETAETPEEQLYNQRQIIETPIFTHCEISPLAQFSIMSSLAPKANHQQGPRTAYQAGMKRQALGVYHRNHRRRFDNNYKVALRPNRPLMEVQTGHLVKLEEMPVSSNLVVAFLADPYNQEDGILLNEDAVERFKLYKYIVIKHIVQEGDLRGVYEQIKFPLVDPSYLKYYAALDPETGYPLPGKVVKIGDYILGKIRRGEYGDIDNVSVRVGEGEDGIIDRVEIEQQNAQTIVKIKIRTLRKYVEGDKAAARYAQKGVIAKILPSKDLPTIIGGINDGIVPDLIVNTHSIPSRMTQGFLQEILSSKASVYCGKRTNGSTYTALFNHPGLLPQQGLQLDFDKLKEILSGYSLNPTGTEKMITPDGNLLQVDVNVGVVAYMMLRHHVKDKFQARGVGASQIATHQPVPGRAKGGGLRFGEMERDSQVSHGASATLKECLFLRSDSYDLALCGKCGIPPTYYHSQSQSMPQFQCRKCRGTDFVRVPIPCSLKYLQQLLAGLCIEMSFVTEKVNEEDILLS